MQGFVESFKPLVARYKSEVILLSCALLISLISAILFFQQTVSENKALEGTEQISTVGTNQMGTNQVGTEHGSVPRTTQKQQTITVDISGAVKRPFVYTFNSYARIIDAIQKAGGLTEDADEAFIKRNMNYARILSDQEKIYIPYLSDTANGYILENTRIIDDTQPNNNTNLSESSSRININSASVLELDQLPGIGKVMSEAIFAARPYTSTEDLVTNNVIKQSVYDKIKDQISVY